MPSLRTLLRSGRRATSQAGAVAGVGAAQGAWAVPARGRTAPPGFAALDLVETLAGAGAPVTEGPQRWWVRSEPWEIVFAPFPERAPHAGLRVRLRAHMYGDRTLLALALSGRPDAATDADLANLVRHEEAVAHLPPGCTDDMLLERLAPLRSRLVEDWGIQVLAIGRCEIDAWADDPAGVPASMPLGALGGSGRVPAAVPGGVAQSEATPADSPPSGVTPTVPLEDLPWSEVQRRDRRAMHRLFIELPLLENRLRAAFGRHGWSDQADFAQRQRLVQDALAALASTVGRRPALGSGDVGLVAGRPPTRVQLQWLAGTAQQAEARLAELRNQIEALTPETVPDDGVLSRLEATAERLARCVAQRHSPWWEVAP